MGVLVKSHKAEGIVNTLLILRISTQFPVKQKKQSRLKHIQAALPYSY
jgi:hypothetical protein